jgi:ATP-dependent exoDNAse (exonuclease V) alpha subunit
MDADRAPGRLVDRRLAYIAVSRARHDVQIYTKNRPAAFQPVLADVKTLAALGPPCVS